MLEEFFIQKANHKHISTLLKKEGFLYTDEDITKLLKGNEKGVRYGNAVLTRNENGTQQKRFIKIVLDGKRKTYLPFKRQVEISAALHADEKYNFPTLAVIHYSLTPPVPYAIFETRESGDNFGFMHDTPECYEQFTQPEIQKLVRVLYAFHRAGFDIQKNVLKLARPMSSKLGFYKNEFNKLLDKKIVHKTKEGREVKERVEKLLIVYTGIHEIRTRLMQILEKCFTQVRASKNDSSFYLVHADMQIDNIYKHADGGFELLDFEWVGKADNPVIAIAFDYGNLRARAWSSPSFQQMLDTTMLEIGMELYPNSEKMLGAALSLGIVRSSLMMSRFHMDVLNTVKKDRRTEKDYFEMYPKTIDALVAGLKMAER